ncbi:MAG TPA: AraC family transcriptional regulator [Haloplasmataceae bacterium]
MDNWEKVNAVQRMQNYISDNINKPITLKMLSNVAGYSPWHTCRIFKELIGITPFEYIRKLRLSKAAIKLRDENPKIIDVAFDYVFDSHEGFTRAFSKQFGVTPNFYSNNTPPIKLFLPYSIRDYYLTLQKGEKKMNNESKVNTVFVQVVERPARKLILKRGIKATEYFEYCEEVGCDIWGILVSIKEALYEPIGMWLPPNLRREGTSEYAQGVEVPIDYAGIVPEGFEIIELPPCKMMIFQGEPYEEENFGEAISSLWKVMKNYNPELYGFRWADEDGPRFQLEPKGYRGYIEGRPVRELNK